MPPQPEMLAGKRFGFLLVQHRTDRERGPYYLCVCDCGGEKEVYASNLRNGLTTSCGCRRSKVTAERNRTHGMSNTATYTTWRTMIDRCTRPNAIGYANYGGRGIRVCDRWLGSFESFISDMGERPDGSSLDRINNDGDYCHENCRWANRVQQGRNKRNNRLIAAFGIELCQAEWARKSGLHASAIHRRLARGWSPERAVTP